MRPGIPRSTMKRPHAGWLRWFFLGILLAPLIVVVGQRDKSFPLPGSVGEAMLLPQDLKFYFAANFEFRNRMAGLHSRLIRAVDGHDRSSDLVKVGKDGWLYFFMDKRNIAAFGQQDTGINHRALAKMQRKHNFCSERGIIYMPLIIPTKTSVYPEYLPDRMARQLGTLHEDVTYLHRFLKTKSSGIRSVDLLKPFLAAKANAPIYFRTDSHWTEYGAYIAAEEVLGELRKTYPNLPQPYSPKPRISFSDCQPGNEARMLGLQHELTERYVELRLPVETTARHQNGSPIVMHAINLKGFESKTTVTRCESAEAKSVVVFQNSFGVALVPYLGRHFKRARFEWSAFAEGVVDSERPTVVIDLFNTL